MSNTIEESPSRFLPLSRRNIRRNRVCAIVRKPDQDPTGEHIPHVHLQGEWLRKLGFVPGVSYTVEGNTDKIVITKLHIPEPVPARYRASFEEAIFEYGESCLAEGLRYDHPGTLVMRHFLIPMGITIRRFAVALDVRLGYAEDFLAGRRNVDGELARRLARYTGTSSELWIELQIQHELGPNDPGILEDPKVA